MQIDGEAAAVIGIISSLVSSTLVAGIGHGIMKEKVRRLENDIESAKQEAKHYVTMKHFDAVIGPLKEAMGVVQRDVKEILHAVSDHHGRAR